MKVSGLHQDVALTQSHGAELDEEAGAELKTNPDVKMILFSDIVEGQSALTTTL